tara:strand:+ start:524 stop:2488 length:1965 start_codon:yes stop_codon:yes gene_type:complete
LRFGKNIYREELSGLRTLAVITAITYNFNKDFIPSGYLGVDIFAVISGYAITCSLAGRQKGDFLNFLSSFYLRRAKRLIPALFVFVFISGTIICILNPNPAESLHTGISSLLGLSNFYLMRISTDYFSSDAELNPFTQTWSLSMEQQFYFFFPFIIWLTGFSRLKKNSIRSLSLTLILLSSISFFSYIYFHRLDPISAYYYMPTRFWELAFGSLICIGTEVNHKIFRLLSKIPSEIIFFLILTTLFLPLEFSLLATILITIFTGCLICTLKKETLIFNLFTNKYVLYISKISYSLYLWRWAIVAFSLWTTGIHWWSIPFQVFILFIVADLSYRFIEFPFQKNKLNKSTKNLFIIGGVITSCLTIFLLSLKIYLKKFIFFNTYAHIDLVTKYRNKFFDTNSKYKSYDGDNCNLPSRTNINDVKEKIDGCIISSSNKNKKIFFVGSSHSSHYRETHVMLSLKNDFSIDGISVSACNFPYYPKQTYCGDIQSWQEKRILNQIKKGDLLVNASIFPVGELSWIDDPDQVKRFLQFSRKVKLKGANTILFGPLPQFDLPLFACTPSWFKPNFALSNDCYITRDEIEDKRRETYKKLKEISEHVYLYNPLNALCFNNICPMIDKENKPIFGDKDHITDYANSKYIYNDFIEFLKGNKLLD